MSDINVLLVTDDDDAVESLERAFDDGDSPGRLHVVDTGEAAVSWLQRDDGFEDTPMPDLLLIDMSATGGTSALETIKSDARYRRLPVLAFADPESQSELETAYDNHANACLNKPADADEYAEVVQSITAFWALTAELPIAYDDEEALP